MRIYGEREQRGNNLFSANIILFWAVHVQATTKQKPYCEVIITTAVGHWTFSNFANCQINSVHAQ